MGIRAKQRYFSELAPRWDGLPAPAGAPGKVQAFVRRAAVAGARRILDAGCGTGILLPALLEQCPEARVVELDLALDMLRVNAGRFADPRALRVCTDGARLPFPGASFDAVLCFGVLPHFEDLAAALAEMRRVLRPGGALAVGHLMGSRELNAFHRSLGQPVAGDVLPPSEELAAHLSRLGMVRIQAEEAPDWYFVRGEKLP
jgi:ubiquinone/menaquinone biosynthesis C-methylase UbiE